MANRTEASVDPSELTVEELAQVEGTDLSRGLTDNQAAEKLLRDGRNELKKPPKPTLLILFVMQLTGFVIILLILAAISSIVVNLFGPERSDLLSYITGEAILVIVIINAGIAAWTEHKAGDALDALAKMSQATVCVLRGGAKLKVDTTLVVRGDIVLLETGDVVPADMRLSEADDIKVAEMALTGEPDDVSKTAKMKPKKEGEEKLTPENMVFSGCSVTNGKGRGIIVETGMGTRIGRIAQLIAGGEGAKPKTKCFGLLPDTSENATPLQHNLDKLGGRIGLIAIVICVCLFILGVALDRRDPSDPNDSAWIYMILISVTLAVAAIPEGIPLCVTISLSIGCKDMVTKEVLVRKLAAVETLGSASVICSDKTGTLTEGKMTMVNMWSGGMRYTVEGKGFDPTIGGFTQQDTGADASQEIGIKTALLSALLCCNTTLCQVEDPKTGELRWEPQGNSSEAPIVVAARKVGFSEVLGPEYSRVMEIPFSSSRKMMLTVSNVPRGELCPGGMALGANASMLTVCKGAPNFVLDFCEKQLCRDGTFEPLTPEMKADVLGVVDDYSCQALRVLAIAVHPLSELPFDKADDDLTTDHKFSLCRKDLCLVGLVASIDPDRDGVKESVGLARGAGIRVVMITGDYLKTAVAIATNVRILQECDDEATSAVDCALLRPDGPYLQDSSMDALTARVRVFARARPEDKLEIVKSLQRQGLVTAMTGDGVNDAPALNQADIGVAMGVQGTEVAKGASDMILMDDNFCSIVSAVEKGRVIYAGIQKFVAFIMSVHIAEVLQIFICIMLGIPVMRTPLQILFLILVTDLPPSIALGMEPGDASVLKQPPRPREEPVVVTWMWINMVLNGLVLFLVIIIVYIVALLTYCEGQIFQGDIDDLDDYETKLMNARTVAFISLVWSENVRSYCARSFDRPIWENMFSNVQMQKAIVLAQLCLYAAVLIPGFNETILGLQGINVFPFGWLVALAGPVGCVLLCESCKILTQYQVRKHQKAVITTHTEEATGSFKVIPDVSGNGRCKDNFGVSAQVIGNCKDNSFAFSEEPTKYPTSTASTGKDPLRMYSLCSCFGIFTPMKTHVLGPSRV